MQNPWLVFRIDFSAAFEETVCIPTSSSNVGTAYLTHFKLLMGCLRVCYFHKNVFLCEEYEWEGYGL